MESLLQKITHHFARRPYSLFLLDGAGAVVTAIALGIVLPRFQSYFGMPHYVLSYLALVALVFCLYSWFCFLMRPQHGANFLRVIALANGMYCVGSLWLVFLYYHVLTPLGLAYFILEIIIILFLVFIEFRVAKFWK